MADGWTVTRTHQRTDGILPTKRKKQVETREKQRYFFFIHTLGAPPIKPLFRLSLSPSLSFLLSLPFFLTPSRSSSLFLCSYFSLSHTLFFLSLSPSFLTPFISYSLSPSFFLFSFFSLSLFFPHSLSTLFSLSFMAFCLFRIFKIH